jgi:hypothetical protein
MAKFGSDHALIHEAVVTGNKVGATEKFWAALAHDEGLFQKTLEFVLSAIKLVFSLVSTFDRDMRKEGWKLEKDNQEADGEFTPELLEFLKEHEPSVVGTEMEERVKNEPIAGQRNLEAMLREQNMIPKEWRKFVLVAPGTVWLGSGRHRLVPCLFWLGERWCLSFDWLGHGFGSDYRVVRLGKYQK